MKKIYRVVFAILLVILVASTFQDLSARQFDPGSPCDPDALPGEIDYCPIDTNVVFLIVGGVGLYFLAARKFITPA